MSLEVKIGEYESQDSLLKRFQRIVQMDGVLREAKAHRYFISKRDAARLKAKKNARRMSRFGKTRKQPMS
jgi:ribosomal protein S21